MNLADLVRESARRVPSKAALIFRDQPVSYFELDREIDRVAAGLASLGVRPGDRVALMVENTPRFVCAFYGALRAGAAIVPLNTMLTSEEVRYILTDAEARVVIVSDPFVATLDGMSNTLPTLENVVVAGTTAPVGAMTWGQLVGPTSSPPDVRTEPEDLACLAYTSGTTGRPKGAMLSHGNLLANLEQMSRVPRMAETETDVVLTVLPLFHIYALNVMLGLTLKEGATTILLERFDAAGSLEALQRHRATILFGAPTTFVAWINTLDLQAHDLSSVRLAVSGAAPLPGAVLEEFRRKTGITVWEGYGLTEAAPAVTTNAMGELAKPGSIGRPLPGIDVRIVDDTGENVEEDDPGELVVKGPNVFAGYWRQPEATKQAFLDGEWLRTGDIGYADEDGYIFLIDRKKDLILVSGFNVYPREVEEVLSQHPKVADVAVVGIRHPYTGEAVKAFAVLKGGERATEEEIIDFCRRSLARFKCPQVVEFVSELPRLASGKVMKRALREPRD